jgi:molecular chaperone Hsp33
LALNGFCRCSRERIAAVLGAFPPEERAEMVEADGRIKVTCEYCSRVYEVTPESVGGPAADAGVQLVSET